MRLLMAILLLASCQFATQLFLPALPDIAEHYQLSTADAQQVIMLYFVFFGLSQLWYGPWTDAVGLRKVFFVGQGVFLTGSVLCYVAVNVEMMSFGRILQGLGAGAPLILSRVILSSTMSGERLQKAFGSLAITASVVAVSAPLIGGWLTTLISWQFVFLTFSVYVVFTTLFGIKVLPHSSGTGEKLVASTMATDYLKLLKDKRFIHAAAFKWWPTLLFLSTSTYLPFAFQQGFGLSPSEFGTYMMFPAMFLIIGSALNRIFQSYYTPMQIIAYFWPLMLICGLVLTFVETGLWLTLAAYSCFMLMCGAYYANALQLAIEPFKNSAGTASALLGAIDMLVFSLLAAFVNRFWVTSLTALGVMFIICSVIILISWLVLNAHRNKDESQDDVELVKAHRCDNDTDEIRLA